MNFDELKEFLLTPLRGQKIPGGARSGNALVNGDLHFFADVFLRHQKNSNYRNWLQTPNAGAKTIRFIEEFFESLGVPLGSIVFKEPLPESLKSENSWGMTSEQRESYRGLLTTYLTKENVAANLNLVGPRCHYDHVQGRAEFVTDVVKSITQELFSSELGKKFATAANHEIAKDPGVLLHIDQLGDTVRRCLIDNLGTWTLGGIQPDLGTPKIERHMIGTREWMGRFLPSELSGLLREIFLRVVPSKLLSSAPVIERVDALETTVIKKAYAEVQKFNF